MPYANYSKIYFAGYLNGSVIEKLISEDWSIECTVVIVSTYTLGFQLGKLDNHEIQTLFIKKKGSVKRLKWLTSSLYNGLSHYKSASKSEYSTVL